MYSATPTEYVERIFVYQREWGERDEHQMTEYM